MDRKALWFAVGIGCTAGLVLLAMVATSNYIQGAPQETIIWLLAPCTPLAGLGGYGLGRGRND
jgi:hypothetical protein